MNKWIQNNKQGQTDKSVGLKQSIFLQNMNITCKHNLLKEAQVYMYLIED